MGIYNKLSSIFRRNPKGELKHIIDAIDQAIDTVSGDIDQLKLETVLTTATGEWLDIWGKWFGIYRMSEEPDFEYRNRMLSLVTTPNNTIPAIIEAIKKLVGDPSAYINIYEPYTNLMRLNLSACNGTDKMMDDTYWRHCVIDISVSEPITSTMMEVVNRITSGGVKAYFNKLSYVGTEPVKFEDIIYTLYSIYYSIYVEDISVGVFEAISQYCGETDIERKYDIATGGEINTNLFAKEELPVLICQEVYNAIPVYPGEQDPVAYVSYRYSAILCDENTQYSNTAWSGREYNLYSECPIIDELTSVTQHTSVTCKPTNVVDELAQPGVNLYTIKDRKLSSFVTWYTMPEFETKVSS